MLYMGTNEGYEKETSDNSELIHRYALTRKTTSTRKVLVLKKYLKYSIGNDKTNKKLTTFLWPSPIEMFEKESTIDLEMR